MEGLFIMFRRHGRHFQFTLYFSLMHNLWIRLENLLILQTPPSFIYSIPSLIYYFQIPSLLYSIVHTLPYSHSSVGIVVLSIITKAPLRVHSRGLMLAPLTTRHSNISSPRPHIRQFCYTRPETTFFVYGTSTSHDQTFARTSNETLSTHLGKTRRSLKPCYDSFPVDHPVAS